MFSIPSISGTRFTLPVHQGHTAGTETILMIDILLETDPHRETVSALFLEIDPATDLGQTDYQLETDHKTDPHLLIGVN